MNKYFLLLLIFEIILNPLVLKANVPTDLYEVDKVGLILIPNSMELKAIIPKEVLDKNQNNIKYKVFADRVVFQQKGLNQLEKSSFETYARVIIETTTGAIGEFNKITSKIILSSKELEEIDRENKKIIMDEMKLSNTALLRWDQTKIESVNNQPALKFSYLRESAIPEKPNVYVEVYSFQNNDRVHTITLSYRVTDRSKWESDFKLILDSFVITYIR